MIKRIVVISVAFMTLSAEGAEPSAKITEYGRYKITVEDLIPTEDVSGGVEIVGKDEKHIQTTKKIPCRVGEAFGWRLKFSNLPRSRPYEVVEIVRHPPIKQPDGKVLKRAVQKYEARAGERLIDNELFVWHFMKGYEYELVPGKWTRQFFIDGKKVAEITFSVLEVKAKSEKK